MRYLPLLVLVCAFYATDALITRVVGFDWIDQHRPETMGFPMDVNVQKQLWHIRSQNRRWPVEQLVPVIGSSTVVNGFDESEANSDSNPSSPQLVNFGMTGLLAYELKLLAKDFIPPGRRTVIYVYDVWSFPDFVLETVAIRRWSSKEAMQFLSPRDLRLADCPEYIEGAMMETLQILPYNDMLREIVFAKINNSEVPEYKLPYDYPILTSRPEVAQLSEPVGRDLLPNGLLIDLVAQSPEDKTLGWSGFESFLEQAVEENVDVLVIPSPLNPNWSYRYGQFGDPDVVDRKINDVCKMRGVPVVPRGEMPEFTVNDFRDDVHLNRWGREAFTRFLRSEYNRR